MMHPLLPSRALRVGPPQWRLGVACGAAAVAEVDERRRCQAMDNINSRRGSQYSWRKGLSLKAGGCPRCATGGRVLESESRPTSTTWRGNQGVRPSVPQQPLIAEARGLRGALQRRDERRHDREGRQGIVLPHPRGDGSLRGVTRRLSHSVLRSTADHADTHLRPH